MTACPRHFCRGAVGLTWYETCFACARPLAGGARAPTAEEEHSRGSGVVTEPDYFGGIYALDYVPTSEELSRAVW